MKKAFAIFKPYVRAIVGSLAVPMKMPLAFSFCLHVSRRKSCTFSYSSHDARVLQTYMSKKTAHVIFPVTDHLPLHVYPEMDDDPYRIHHCVKDKPVRKPDFTCSV
jgi:hypothetical protein